MIAVFRALTAVILVMSGGMALAAEAPTSTAADAPKPEAVPEAATEGQEARKPPVLPEPKALPRDVAGECAWTGKRVLTLLARDDVDQANKFLGFYRLFGCSEAHLAPTFRCIVEAPAPEPAAVNGGEGNGGEGNGAGAQPGNGLAAQIDRCWARGD